MSSLASPRLASPCLVLSGLIVSCLVWSVLWSLVFGLVFRLYLFVFLALLSLRLYLSCLSSSLPVVCLRVRIRVGEIYSDLLLFIHLDFCGPAK